MNVTEPRPIAPADTDTQQWWDATRERRLLVQRCDACGHHQLYPRALCTSCGARAPELVPATGRGTVYSYTTVHRAPHPAFIPPYVVAMVRLEEGPVVLTNIVGADPADIRCDMPVRVAWEALPDGRHLPLFEPEGA